MSLRGKLTNTIIINRLSFLNFLEYFNGLYLLHESRSISEFKWVAKVNRYGVQINAQKVLQKIQQHNELYGEYFYFLYENKRQKLTLTARCSVGSRKKDY